MYVIPNEKFRTLQIPPGRTGNARGKVGRLSNLCLEFIGKKKKKENYTMNQSLPQTCFFKV